MNRISIIGLGWFGMELAKALEGDFEVVGSKRSVPDEKFKNIEVLPLDINSIGWEKDVKRILEADAVLLNIPPSGAKSKDEFVSKSKKIIDLALELGVDHFVFISSTGVFSNDQVSVDENTSPKPGGGNGQYLVHIESHLANSAIPNKHIIRPGGLVGGNRHPVFYLAGRTDVSGRLHPVNLVHRKDLVNLTKAVFLQRPGQTFLHAVAPDHPSKKMYYEKAAGYFHLSPPNFSADSSEGKKVLSELSAEILNFHYEYLSPSHMLSTIRRT